MARGDIFAAVAGDAARLAPMTAPPPAAATKRKSRRDTLLLGGSCWLIHVSIEAALVSNCMSFPASARFNRDREATGTAALAGHAIENELSRSRW
jgi:hypothetical protein